MRGYRERFLYFRARSLYTRELGFADKLQTYENGPRHALESLFGL
jgi:hypothetical protein